MNLIFPVVAPFMEDWGGELEKAWNTLMQFPPARRLKEAVVVAINKVSLSTSEKDSSTYNNMTLTSVS